MSALPPETLEERRRKSNRLALTILAAAGGCGCLWFVFAFVGGMVMGFMNARNKQPLLLPPPIHAPSDTDSRVNDPRDGSSHPPRVRTSR